MAVYLSPGVYPREIDLSLVASNPGPLRPAFIGTAQRGPLNVPTFVSSAESAINLFGEPFAESYLMYAILAYMQDGDACYVMRVGVEYSMSTPAALLSVSIDDSSNKTYGWGRIPVFTGIDYGRIRLKTPTVDNPVVFHAASVSTPIFYNISAEGTSPTTEASLAVSGVYQGTIQKSYYLEITSDTTFNETSQLFDKLNGATYRVIDSFYDSNSSDYVVATGTLVDANNDGTSSSFSIDGVSLTGILTVPEGRITAGDYFAFGMIPDNREWRIAVEGTAHPQMDAIAAGTYVTTATLVAALNNSLVSTGGHDYMFVTITDETGITAPELRTVSNGDRIQIFDGEAWALTLGVSLYQYDIPRGRIISTKTDPYDISVDNDQIVIKVTSSTGSQTITTSLLTGFTQSATSIAAQINASGTVAGIKYYEAFAIDVPNSSSMALVIAVSPNNEQDTIYLLANYSNLKSLRFTEETGILYPYGGSYRGFFDNRVLLPIESQDPYTPQSCEDDPLSEECAQDSAYYQSIVGWFVGTSAGTWIGTYDSVKDSYSGHTVSLQASGGIAGSSRISYTLTVKDSQGFSIDVISDVSFDPTDSRYVGNILNPGTAIGGSNGNQTINWIERPEYTNAPYEVPVVVRQPASFSNRPFRGMANGIPSDPALSATYLDAAVIGNPATSTGLYAFQNPEAFDINLLLIPGFSSGAVIGSALQLCENRGDVLYIIDPPIGLRPQQVVDWHNGILYDDLDKAINSSYGALYWSWLRIFDQFSSEERWVPPSGHVAGIFSRTAQNTEWFAPAGLRRGIINTALSVEYNPTQSERDLLYGSGNCVNPIVNFAQEGIVVFGQRTLQRSATALDRVNVRMLMIYIKKALTSTLRNYIFEPNDKTLWAQIKNVVEPFLADIAARRGLSGWKVIVDASNNTSERIDRNELWVTVFLQPTKTVEFVALNLAVLKTGASFAAEESLAAAGLVTVG